MSKDSPMVRQVRFIIVVRRIRTLGIAITVGIIAIYVFGLLVANKNVRENFDMINLGTLIFLVLTIPVTLFIKKMMMKKVSISNFENTYFNAHVITFSIMDLAALFCITTNLFVNGNILYASFGVVVSVAGMILIFPKEEDFEKLNQEN